MALIIGFSVVLVILLIVGLFIQFNHKYLGPYRLKRRLKLPPLNNLNQLGFKVLNAQYYSGIDSKYLVNVGFNWNSISTVAKPCIWIEVFFNDKSGRLNKKKFEKKYNSGFWSTKRRLYHWKCGSVYFEHEYNFIPPSFNSLVNDIYNIIEILRSEDLVPFLNPILPPSYTEQSWTTPFGYFKSMIKRNS